MSAEIPELDDDQLQQIYSWIDEIPLSRPKRNIARDFSDGVLLAEVIHHYFPTKVELHNYSPANSVKQKMYNWATLNSKVLRRMKVPISSEEIEALVNCQAGMIEVILMRVQQRIAEIRANRRSGGGSVGGGSRGSFGTPMSASRRGGSGGQAAVGDVGQRYDDHHRHPHHLVHDSSERAGADARISNELVAEKDRRIQELEETVEFQELKISKLEQLVRLKDSRIQTLQARLESQHAGMG